MNLIVVEDDKLIRECLKYLLGGEESFELVQTFACAEDAIKKGSWKKADILVTDLYLPVMGGVDLISWCRSNHPSVSCMAYTVSDSSKTVFSAIRAGACGYVLKGASPRELIESIHELYQGGAPMSPKIARKVISEFHSCRVQENLLTSRETEILNSLDQGLSYKEIAADLKISPHTVHTHIKKIYEKVEACNRDDALHKARRFGLI